MDRNMMDPFGIRQNAMSNKAKGIDEIQMALAGTNPGAQPPNQMQVQQQQVPKPLPQAMMPNGQRMNMPPVPSAAAMTAQQRLQQNPNLVHGARMTLNRVVAAEAQKQADARFKAVYDIAKPVYGEQQAMQIARLAASDEGVAGEIMGALTEHNQNIRDRNQTSYDQLQLKGPVFESFTDLGIPEEVAGNFAAAVSRGEGSVQSFTELWREGMEAGASNEQMESLAKLGSFMNAFYDPRTPDVIGPWNQFVSQRILRKYSNPDEFAHQEFLQEKLVTDWLAFGGKVLKGNQSDKEWDNVAKTRPKLEDPAEVWLKFFNDSLDVLEDFGANEAIVAQAKVMRKQLHQQYREIYGDIPKSITGGPAIPYRANNEERSRDEAMSEYLSLIGDRD